MGGSEGNILINIILSIYMTPFHSFSVMQLNQLNTQSSTSSHAFGSQVFEPQTSDWSIRIDGGGGECVSCLISSLATTLFQEWSAEGYQLWMVKRQPDHDPGGNGTFDCVIQLEFVKSALTVNPCMVCMFRICQECADCKPLNGIYVHHFRLLFSEC
jgi:hypothetical protein